MEFRLLNADEIELRVGTVGKTGYTLLLYKDARCDMNILDETLGAENWQRDHKEVKGNLYCGVAIWDKEKSQWVWKWDCGAESNTEKEKGEASDSFKRACFNLGIGRELYTSPFVFIQCETTSNNGKYVLPNEEKNRRFKVVEIEYVARKISKLTIADAKTKEVFYKFGSEAQKPEEKKASHYSGIHCEGCDVDISDNVAKYSKQTYGKYLCYKCQKEQPLKEVEV